MHGEQGLHDAAHHPVGDRERERPVLVEDLDAVYHDPTSPSRDDFRNRVLCIALTISLYEYDETVWATVTNFEFGMSNLVSSIT